MFRAIENKDGTIEIYCSHTDDQKSVADVWRMRDHIAGHEQAKKEQTEIAQLFISSHKYLGALQSIRANLFDRGFSNRDAEIILIDEALMQEPIQKAQVQ